MNTHTEPQVSFLAFRGRVIATFSQIAPASCSPISAVEPVSVRGKKLFKFFLFAPKEDGRVGIEQIVETERVNVSNKVYSMNYGGVVGQVPDRPTKISLFFEIGKSVFAKFFRGQKAHSGAYEAGASIGQNDTSIPVKVAAHKMAKKILRHLILGGESEDGCFSRKAPETIQVVVNLWARYGKLTHHCIITKAPVFFIDPRSVNPVNQNRKLLKETMVHDGKSDNQHLVTRDTSIRIQKSQPVGFSLGVNNRENALVFGKTSIRRASGSERNAVTDQHRFDSAWRHTIFFGESFAAFELAGVFLDDFFFSFN